ncbi:MAG: hypothetical protein J7L15_00310 [Clostridiales bacterium]|nr:hypothetical protein [Clostridiales bacterium]
MFEKYGYDNFFKTKEFKEIVGDQHDTTKEFIQKSNTKHLNLYTYDNTTYISSQEHVLVTCSIHGDWKVRPYNHIQGSGCPICANIRTQKQKYQNKKTTLYYIYFPDYNLYKIGLTQTSVNNRFKRDDIAYNIISTKTFENGLDALQLEQQILSKYNQYQYKGPKILQGGNTELFTENVLDA